MMEHYTAQDLLITPVVATGMLALMIFWQRITSGTWRMEPTAWNFLRCFYVFVLLFGYTMVLFDDIVAAWNRVPLLVGSVGVSVLMLYIYWVTFWTRSAIALEAEQRARIQVPTPSQGTQQTGATRQIWQVIGLLWLAAYVVGATIIFLRRH